MAFPSVCMAVGLTIVHRWVYAAKPLVQPGPPGSFDHVSLRPAAQFVTKDDEHWLYYEVGSGLQFQAFIADLQGCPQRHEQRFMGGCKIGIDQALICLCVTGFAEGLARFRRDGLLYLAPLVTCCHPQRIPRLISNCPQGDAAGTVTTKPFLLEGGQLWLNVNLSHPHAAVQIAVLDASHKELVGFGCADGSGLGHQRNAALEVQYLWHRSLHKLRNQVGHRAAHRVAARSIRLY